MRPLLRDAVPAVVAAAAVYVFVALALDAGTPKEAAFATAALMLVVAACGGPFSTEDGLLRGAIRCGAFGVCAGIACLVAGGTLAALLCGLFAGLYAFALGSVGTALRARWARVAVALAGLAVMTTLHVWDDVHLLQAADRKASASLAFHVNPAAVVSTTLDYDWIHAPELYRNNQTAESMFGIELGGIAGYALILFVLCIVAVPLGRRR